MKTSWDRKTLIRSCGSNYSKLKSTLIRYPVTSVPPILCHLTSSSTKNKERKYIKAIFHFKDKYGCQFLYRLEHLINILPLLISIHICEGKVYLNTILHLKICRLYDGLFANTTTHFIPCKPIPVFRVVGKITLRVTKNHIMDFT